MRRILSVCMALRASCVLAASAPPPHRIILISVDDLRYDRAVGEPWEGLSRDAVRFDRAYSAATWTLPSHASMLTGLYPGTHGAGGPFDQVHIRGLDSKVAFLPAELAAAGYRTAAFVDAAYLGPTFGMDRGFSQFTLFKPRRATENLPAALAWMVAHKDDKTFVFIHSHDVHQFIRVARDRSRSGSFLCPPPLDYDRAFPEPVAVAQSAQQCRQATYDYDNAVHCFKLELSVFLDQLRRAGLYNDSLIVITSDHGESLCEGGDVRRQGHAGLPREEQAHVPLFIKFQTERALTEIVSTTSVSLVDLAPTLLAAAGAAIPAVAQGTDLFAERLDLSRAVFAQSDEWTSVRKGARTLLAYADGRRLLLDAARDPLEQIDFSTSEAAAFTEMSADLARFFEASASHRSLGTRATVGADVKESLKAAGYILR